MPKAARLPTILILGRSGVGKSSMGSLLAKSVDNWRSCSVSDAIIEYFATEMGNSVEDIVLNKDHFRQELIRRTEAVTETNPSFFVQRALLKANIVNGIRREYELRESIAFFDISIGISNDEIANYTDNFDLPGRIIESCDIYIERVAPDCFGPLIPAILQRIRGANVEAL